MARSNKELLEELLDVKKEAQDLATLLADCAAQRDNWRKSTEDLRGEKGSHLAQIESLDADNKRLTQATLAAQQKQRHAEAERDEVNAENQKLRDRLHAMSIENARLEGYRERVQEFDPVSERQLHSEQTGRERPYRPDARLVDAACYGTDMRETWYQRRA